MTAPRAREPSGPLSPPDRRPPRRGGGSSPSPYICAASAAGWPAGPARLCGARRGLVRSARALAAAALLALCGALALPATAQADVLVSNIEQSVNTFNQLDALSDDQSLRFTTGGTTSDSYNIDSVEIRIDDFRVATGTVSVYSDNSEVPGTSLFTFDNPTAGITARAINTFTAPANTTLTGGTSYHIVVSATSAPDANTPRFELVRTFSDGEDAEGEDDWAIDNFGYSGSTRSAATMMLRVNGSAVSGGTLSTDATLSALSLGAGVTVSQSGNAYTASVANSVDKVTVTPATNHTGANFVYLTASDNMLPDAVTGTAGHQVALDVGDTVFKVKVTAEDGTTTQTYTVTVTRAGASDTAPVWSATMTAGNTLAGHGYDATDTPAIGGLDADDNFDYGSTPGTTVSYRVVAIDVATNNVVRFVVSPIELASDETLTLEFGGHALPFSDRIAAISILGSVIWPVPAALDDLENEFPVGSTATVCLRTATQVCPTGRIVTPNTPPEFPFSAATFNVPENSAVGTVIAGSALALTATDADSDTLTYTLEGTDKDSFAHDSVTGGLKTVANVDYEVKDNYSLTVKADDGNGGTATIPVVIDVTDLEEQSAQPAKPTLTAVTGSSTSLTATWETPDRNGGPAITGYNVQYKVSTTSSWTDFTHDSTEVTTTITGLMASTEYQVRVQAKNGETDSVYSDPSDAVSTNAAMTLPTLSIDDAEGDEGGDVTFTVTLSEASTETVTVAVATSVETGDTATSGTDFTAKTETLTFAAGENEKTVTVATAGDELAEGNETFTLTLSSPSNATLSTTAATAKGTIVDDDQPTVGFASESVDQFIVEASGEIKFKVVLSATSTVPITVDWATEAGSAEADMDYTEASGTLTFAPGDMEKTITVAIIDDDLLEGQDKFTVRLSGTDDALVTLGTSSVEARIIDRDMATISVAEETTVDEDVGTVTLTLTASAMAVDAMRFDYRTEDGTAEAGADYTAANGRVTIPAGETERTITITVLDDTADEDREDFKVRLVDAAGDDRDRRLILPTAPASVLIEDDDPEPTLSVADAEATEGSPVVFTVALSAASGKTVTVAVATSVETGDTATSGTDFTAKTETLTFAVGENEKTVTVATAGDELAEGNETFTLTLSNPTNATIPDATAKGTIENLPTLSIANASANEGSSISFPLTLSAAAGGLVAVNCVASFGSGDTAVAADLSNTAAAASIRPGEVAGSCSFNSVQDNTDEEDEIFTVTLTSVSTNAQLAADPTAKGTITDDDPTPTVTVADAEATEGSPVVFTVTLSAVSGRDVEVGYATSVATDDTAVSGTDFTAKTETLTFAAGENEKTVTVATAGDELAEGNETFTLTLSSPSNATLSTTAATAKGTIVDDDQPTVGFASESVDQFIVEASGEIKFKVVLSATSTVPITVDWATEAGSAEADMDYTEASGTLTFAPGDMEKTITVAIIDDDLLEGQDKFTVRLSGTDDALVTLGTSSVEARIIDRDMATISVAEETTVDEDVGTVTLTLTASAMAVDAMRFDYRTEDGTAEAGADYTAANGRVTIPAGETERTITITVLDDTADEDREDFKVRLVDAAGDDRDRRLILPTAPASVLIEDDDPEPTLSVADAEATEGSPVVFTVALSAASGKTVTVAVATSVETGDTATSGTDFTAVASTTLTFDAGQEEKTITVQTTEDTANEENETFTVTLSNPTNATIPDATAKGTIEDDDEPNAAPSFDSSASHHVAENTTAVVTVTARDADTGDDVTGYAITGGADQALFEIGATTGVLTTWSRCRRRAARASGRRPRRRRSR